MAANLLVWRQPEVAVMVCPVTFVFYPIEERSLQFWKWGTTDVRFVSIENVRISGLWTRRFFLPLLDGFTGLGVTVHLSRRIRLPVSNENIFSGYPNGAGKRRIGRFLQANAYP